MPPITITHDSLPFFHSSDSKTTLSIWLLFTDEHAKFPCLSIEKTYPVMDKAHEAEQFLWHRRFLYSHGGFYSLVGRNFHRLIRNHALFSIIFFFIRVCDETCKLVFIPEKVKKHIEAVRLGFFHVWCFLIIVCLVVKIFGCYKFYQPLILYCWSMYVLLLWFVFFFLIKTDYFLMQDRWC